jgi:predicted peroxiredoxin
MSGSLLLTAVILMSTVSISAEQAATSTKPRILVHLTSGPENPTKAALAFLVARTAIEQGHPVTLFLAGDGVQLLRDTVLDGLSGVGTGKLREHYDVIVKGGGKFYLSGMSSSARGVTAADLQGKPAELAPPAILLKLTLDSDRMFTY